MNDDIVKLMREHIATEAKKKSDEAYMLGDAWGVSNEQSKLYAQSDGLKRAVEIIDEYINEKQNETTLSAFIIRNRYTKKNILHVNLVDDNIQQLQVGEYKLIVTKNY